MGIGGRSLIVRLIVLSPAAQAQEPGIRPTGQTAAMTARLRSNFGGACADLPLLRRGWRRGPGPRRLGSFPARRKSSRVTPMTTPRRIPSASAGGRTLLARFGWPLVFFCALLLYALNLPKTYVGFYQDDADYVLAALSLLRGRYVQLRLPGMPALNNHWPGFPLFLVPWVKMVEPHWMLLKAASLACVLLSVGVLGRWTSRRFSAAFALALPALFAWNPSTVSLSGAVMSEPLFLLLVLLVLSPLDRREHSSAF